MTTATQCQRSMLLGLWAGLRFHRICNLQRGLSHISCSVTVSDYHHPHRKPCFSCYQQRQSPVNRHSWWVSPSQPCFASLIFIQPTFLHPSISASLPKKGIWISFSPFSKSTSPCPTDLYPFILPHPATALETGGQCQDLPTYAVPRPFPPSWR